MRVASFRAGTREKRGYTYVTVSVCLTATPSFAFDGSKTGREHTPHPAAWMEESRCSGELSGAHRRRGLALRFEPANVLCSAADCVSRASQLLLRWPALSGHASLVAAGAPVGLSLCCHLAGSVVVQCTAFAPRWDRDR